MRYLLFIAIILSLQSCSQQSATKEYKIYDDYSLVKTQMIAINESVQNIPGKQLETFGLLKKLIEAYPLSQTSLILLASAKNLTAVQYNSLYDALNPALRQNPYWTSVELTKTQIPVAETGSSFPDIILKDTLNTSINTSSYKGKILFLDLWSSWCTSCRKEFPALKQVYANYKSKGFEIIGVSIDANKDAWIRALKHDSVPWPQYCEFVYFQENSLAKRFHIMAIPSNFLIDRNGILIGQDLSPKELEILISRL